MQRVETKKRLEKRKKEKEKQKKNDGMGCMGYSFADDNPMLYISLDLFCVGVGLFLLFVVSHKQVTASSECSVHSDKIITREARKE